MPPASPPARPRDVAIDCMRGVAILLVVAYHAGPIGWRFPPYGADGWIEPSRFAWHGAGWLALPLLHFGYAGVHLFFVISGFCIHASCRRGRDLFPAGGGLDRDGARRYALRRLLRLAPPYWIALGIFGVAVPAIALRLGRPAALPSWWDLEAHALFLHGLFEHSIFSINPAFWSMSTEVQFYLAYPLVAWAIGRLGMGRVLVASLLLSIGWRAAVLAAWAPTAEHFMIYRVWMHGFFVPRWFEWILGCWLAESLAHEGGAPLLGRARAAGIGGALMLALGLACRVHVVIDKLFADTLLSTGFALLLGAMLAAERDPGAEARGPGPLPRALAVVGRRSYGTYLVHQPILDGDWLPLAPRLALAAGASAIFSLACERPFERLSRRVRRTSPIAATPVDRDPSYVDRRERK